MIPIIIKIKKAVKQYTIRKGKGSQTHLVDSEVELKNWPHPADAVKITEAKKYEEQKIQAYTDGSKNEQGFGSGVAIIAGQELAAQVKLKLDSRCSNNQTEQQAIVEALEAIEPLAIPEDSSRTAAMFTESRITLDSLKKANNHAYIIEEIGNRVSTLESLIWTIQFSWVKAHVGIHGNEMADRLAKEAARNQDSKIEFNRIPKSTYYNEIAETSKQKW
jgi:ribonuclease HI